MALSVMRSSSSGISGFFSCGGTGFAFICCTAISPSVLPVNGRPPVSISYIITPRE